MSDLELLQRELSLARYFGAFNFLF